MDENDLKNGNSRNVKKSKDGIDVAIQSVDEDELDYEDDLDQDDVYRDEGNDQTSGGSSSEEEQPDKNENTVDSPGTDTIQWKSKNKGLQRKKKWSIKDLGSDSDTDDDEQLACNLGIQRLFDKMLQKHIDDGTITAKKRPVDAAKGKSKKGNSPIIKSPSDTTIYVPALQKLQRQIGAESNLIQNKRDNPIDNIASFIQGVHLENNRQSLRGPEEDYEDQSESIADQEMSEEEKLEPVPSTSKKQDQLKEAREKVNKLIVEAEQFKAMIEDPKGKYANLLNITALPDEEKLMKEMKEPNRGQFRKLSEEDTELKDDEFFHITCHMDPTLRSKIEKGEFVELEKLLPKNRNKNNEGKLEWVHKEGMTYLAPVERDNRISGVRRWEQAFRVYAAIYSKAHPERSAEIWQYIHVINTAASTYIWDNVANYDYTFRQLMSNNPQRSWCRTYNQYWNLSMKDHIVNQIKGGNNYGQSNQKRQSSNKKNDHCWKFNKGACTQGKNCKWIHKCKYCDSTDHSFNNCNKRNSRPTYEPPSGK